MIDEANAILSAAILLLAGGMWPLGFMFGMCSECCGPNDTCPWLLEFDRCLRISFVGSDPPAGGDCRIISSRAGSGDVQYMTSSNPTFQIHNVQSKIRITVRLSLSASGASRTPVGETRTQVWRFNRASPTSPAATVYDTLGPAWHLQVDLSVTGVATQQEAGVVSSIEEDSEGQPKLVLQVNQWTATITHDQSVELFPTGLQRWGPGIGGTEFFRLTASSLTATRQSGDAVSGWSVSKSTGLTIDERKLALRVFGNACTLGRPSAFETLRERVFLDEDTVADFLNGNEDIQFTTTEGALRDLRVMPNNALCEASRDLLGTGIAAGIYPQSIYANVPESLISQDPWWCAQSATFELTVPATAVCASGYTSPVLRKPNFQFVLGSQDSIFWPVDIGSFFAGRTLLWNLEQGAYRTSFVSSGPSGAATSGFTYSIEGSGTIDEFFLAPRRISVCPNGFISGFGATCIPSSLTVGFSETINVGLYNPSNDGQGWTLTQVGEKTEVQLAGTATLGLQSLAPSALTRLQLGAPPAPAAVGYYVGQSEYLGPISVGGYQAVVLFGATAYFQQTCDVPSEQTVAVRLGADFFNQTSPGFLWLTDAGVRRFLAVNNGGPGDPYESDFLESTTFSIKHWFRQSCGPWSETTIPSDGLTISRECHYTNQQETVDHFIETVPVSTSRSRFSKLFSPGLRVAGAGAAAVTQLGRCRLFGLADATQSPRAQVAQPQIVSATANQCLSYFPLFGETDGTLCAGDLSSSTTIPCDGCAPSVEVISGDENASVQYIAEGDKAGVIQVVAKRTWLGGQGVTFTATCGNDTITQTVRRANTAPTPPRNLTATRGPCSQAALQWEVPEGDGGQPITTYTIEFRRIGGSFATFGTVAAPALSATVSPLLRLGYEFRVSATNSVGTSGFSNSAFVDNFTLGAPTNLAVVRGPCTGATLSWTHPSQTECVVVADYLLQGRVFNVGSYATLAMVGGTATSGTVSGLTEGTRYQFRVVRVDDADTQVASAVVVSGNEPALPTNITRQLGQNLGEVDVAWDAVEEPCFENTAYLVQYFLSGSSNWVNGPTSVAKFATVTGLTPGGVYFFRVRATNSVGNSDFSTASSPITIPQA